MTFPINQYYTLGNPIDSFSDNGSFHTISRDNEGKSPTNTIFGESVVGFRQDDISIQFQYNNSTRDITETTSGTGSITNGNSQAEIHTGLGVGEAELQSLDSIRYRPGHECVMMFTTLYDTPEVNVRQQHGLLDDIDGISFGFEDTSFGVFFLEGSNETFIPQTDWNLDRMDGTEDFNTNRSGFNLDPTKFNIYRISYGWFGIAPIIFSIYTGAQKGWVPVHAIDLVNTDIEPHLNNPSLPMKARIERTSGSGADLHMRTSSWRGGVVAGQEEQNSSNRWFSFTELAFVPTAGATSPIFTLRNNLTFQGKNNHVAAELAIVRFTTDVNFSVSLVGIFNGTLGGTPSFVATDPVNSIMSVDSAATSITGGFLGAETVLGKSDAERSDIRGTGVIIRPGNDFTLAVTAPAGTNGTVSGSFRWLEKF